jgi:hypothetical protein
MDCPPKKLRKPKTKCVPDSKWEDLDLLNQSESDIDRP